MEIAENCCVLCRPQALPRAGSCDRFLVYALPFLFRAPDSPFGRSGRELTRIATMEKRAFCLNIGAELCYRREDFFTGKRLCEDASNRGLWGRLGSEFRPFGPVTIC